MTLVTFERTMKAGAVLFATLCVVLLIVPEWIQLLFGLDPNETAAVMSRRAAVLFMGLAGLSVSLAGLHEARTRRTVAGSMAMLLLGLALLGIVEWGLGRVGSGIWLAIVGEIVFGAAFLRFTRST